MLRGCDDIFLWFPLLLFELYVSVLLPITLMIHLKLVARLCPYILLDLLLMYICLFGSDKDVSLFNCLLVSVYNFCIRFYAWFFSYLQRRCCSNF